LARALPASLAAELEPGGHVAEAAAPRHQRLGLEHVAGPAVDARERLAETDTVPDDGFSRPAATFSSVGLAATRGADDGDELAFATESVTSFTAVYDAPPEPAKVQVISLNSRQSWAKQSGSG
jgi:hypothetical protein